MEYLLILVTIVIILSLLVYFILIRGSWPNKPGFDIDFETVRKMAISREGNLPLKINILTIANGELPGWAVSAGDFGKNNSPIDFPCFQLVYKNKTGIIEAPYNKRLFNKFRFGKEYFPENYELMQQALLEADFIVPTHEHWDHLGGIAQSENIEKIIGKTILTREQVNGPTISDAEFPENILSKYNPLDYKKYHCIAPGVVLIKAPGHSVGHQFIFVRHQNGTEFLFTGDVFWVNRNFETRKNRPWIASKKRLENRKQIAHQMKYLYNNFYLNKSQEINMLSTHDPKQHENYIRNGLISRGIQLNSYQH